jgi:hypothetical protein
MVILPEITVADLRDAAPGARRAFAGRGHGDLEGRGDHEIAVPQERRSWPTGR